MLPWYTTTQAADVIFRTTAAAYVSCFFLMIDYSGSILKTSQLIRTASSRAAGLWIECTSSRSVFCAWKCLRRVVSNFVRVYTHTTVPAFAQHMTTHPFWNHVKDYDGRIRAGRHACIIVKQSGYAPHAWKLFT